MAWIEPGNRYLNSSEMDNNAWEIYNFFRGLSNPWTVESISAMIGNMQLESTVNPQRENANSGAYGLVQWLTNKQRMITWCQQNGLNYTTGNAQVQRLEWERANPGPSGADQWYATPEYNLTMSEFAYNSNHESLDYLTASFKFDYERNKTDSDTPIRQQYARHYLELFGGTPPSGGLIKKIIGYFLKPVYYLPYTRFKN